jgi:trigger factor
MPVLAGTAVARALLLCYNFVYLSKENPPLKVTEQTIEERQAFLTIELEPDQVNEAMRRAARTVARTMRIPGFRPGKAPYPVVLARAGRDALLDQAIGDLGAEAVTTAIKEQGLTPIATPQVDVVSRDPVTFKAVVPLTPTVTLGDYRSIRLDPPEVVVDEAQVDALLAGLQAENAPIIPVERGAMLGDQLVADVTGTLNRRTIAQETNTTFILSEEAVRELPPGFADRLVGMTAGETRTFRLTYPADFPKAELAGGEAEFTVTIHAVKERRLPPIDDELARTVGDFESLEALKTRLRENLRTQAEARALANLRQAALTELINRSVVEFPPIMVEQEIDQMIEEQRENLRQGRLTLEQWLSGQNKTLDEFRADLWSAARRRLTGGLVLRELALQEHIELAPGEAEAAGTTEARLLTEKVFTRLLEIATSS